MPIRYIAMTAPIDAIISRNVHFCLRVHPGRTINQLAEDSGISQPRLSRLMNLKAGWTASNIESAARALNVPPSALMIEPEENETDLTSIDSELCELADRTQALSPSSANIVALSAIRTYLSAIIDLRIGVLLRFSSRGQSFLPSSGSDIDELRQIARHASGSLVPLYTELRARTSGTHLNSALVRMYRLINQLELEGTNIVLNDVFDDAKRYLEGWRGLAVGEEIDLCLEAMQIIFPKLEELSSD